MRSSRAGVVVLALLLALLLAGCSAGTTKDKREPASPDDLPAERVLTIATFNVLGSNHTAGDGDGVKAWGTGVERVPGIVERLESFEPDLLGIQEFQDAQKRALFDEVRDTYGYHGERDNGVMWRRSMFAKLSTSFVTIPYFRGHPKRMPVVRLRLRASGEEITLLGVHNPADVGHDASAYREEAVLIERAFVAEERRRGRVVFLVGDLNAHEEAYCPLAKGGLLVSANGGCVRRRGVHASRGDADRLDPRRRCDVQRVRLRRLDLRRRGVRPPLRRGDRQRPRAVTLAGGARLAGRLLLAAALLVAGVAHFRSTEEFLGQVPTFLPLREEVVIVSGVVELVLGVALLALRGDLLARLGWVVAVFFVAVFPGNVWQAVHGSDSFGLDSTTSRVVRLFFQPVLVAWALWCTGWWARRQT